ncbi:hypothetical protein PMAA_035920 [Talaromyces marneffei ATCC 18224]|uniref:Uncharacterized protein n=1 Tax=Talaromyces marneffei (strain ATCC 18224 / CBS 334.59 / QM 7333) TaxID=441960 RepID=B6Q7R4_TALMQ|nr:hypothetical protein PMAA_035920 [Talaromyces marneffei ATCC 18224]
MTAISTPKEPWKSIHVERELKGSGELEFIGKTLPLTTPGTPRAFNDRSAATAPIGMLEQRCAPEHWCQRCPSPVMGPSSLGELGHALRALFEKIHFVVTETAYERRVLSALGSGERMRLFQFLAEILRIVYNCM